MMRLLLSLLIFLNVSVCAEAVGLNRFPFRPFDDVKRPKTADEVEISYQMLVDRRDGIDSLEAKLIALHEMVQKHMDVGYELGKPRIVTETTQEWQVGIPSRFSINDNRRPPDFLVCVDKKKGAVTCFGPAKGAH